MVPWSQGNRNGSSPRDLDALHDRLARGDIRAVFNHALPSDLVRFAGTPAFVYPPFVYLSPQAHTRMQDLLITNLETAR